jgi:hypothetical protein
MPSGQFTVTGSPISSAGTFAVTLNSPTGTGAIVLANTPTLVTPNIGAAVATGVSLASGGSDTNCWNTNGTTATCGGSAITVGSTTIGSGTNGYILYDNSGTLGDLATTGSGNVVLAGSPTFTGTVTATTIDVTNSIVGGALTITPGSSSVIGSGGSYSAPACDPVSGVVCTSLSGIVAFTTGSGSLSNGTVAVLNFSPSKPNYAICLFSGSLFGPVISSGSAVNVEVSSALANNTSYTFGYICN